MIESELAFLEVQVEPLGANTPPLRQAGFGRAPETFDAIDVNAAASRELVGAMQDPMMLPVAHIDQAGIAAPPIRMNNAVASDPPPQNGLQRRFARIGYDLRVDLAVALEDPEHDGFAARPPAALAFDPSRPKVGLIDLHGAPPRGSALTDLGHPLPQGEEVAIDRIAVEPCEDRHFGGLQIQGEQPDHLSKPGIRNMRMMDVPIFLRHDCRV